MLLSRYLSDWEIGEYEELLSMLSYVSLARSINTPRWCLASDRSFSVKSFYKKLYKYGDDDIHFPIR